MALREMVPADQAAVNALWESVWWPQRSDAGWRWLAQNPVLKEIEAPQGWVFEEETGAISVVLGALVQRFWYQNASLYGLTGHSLVVAPHMRGCSRHMINRIINQPGFFACYTLNANSLSHRLYGRFGFAPHPEETADMKLAWVLDPIACLKARVLRKALAGQPKLARRIGERLLPKGLWRASPIIRTPNVRRLESFDAAYDTFWQALKTESGLIADRSPEIQQWRHSDPDLTLAPVVLAYGKAGVITGYASALFAKENPIEPLVLEIIDVVALGCAPDALSSLLAELIHIARHNGAAAGRMPMCVLAQTRHLRANGSRPPMTVTCS